MSLNLKQVTLLCVVFFLIVSLHWLVLSLQRGITVPIGVINSLLPTNENLQLPAAEFSNCTQEKLQENQATIPSSRISCNIGFVLHQGVCVQCPSGKFSLASWIACQMLLDCNAVEHETTQKELLYSLVHWRFYNADWQGYQIVYATFNALSKTSVNYDAIWLFSPSPEFLYPIGSCKERGVVLFAFNSTFVEVGNNFEAEFKRRPQCDSCKVRFHLAVSYVKILVSLHATNTVLCNSWTLQLLLSQFLISNDFRLVLSTLDNLPQDKGGHVLCHKRELTEYLVAPEQRWPYLSVKLFNLDEQPKYGTMSDIWKVPDIAASFLSPCTRVLDYLYSIHIKCKEMNPKARPTANEVLKEYEQIWVLGLFSE